MIIDVFLRDHGVWTSTMFRVTGDCPNVTEDDFVLGVQNTY